MEIEAQMAEDRERAAAEKLREEERSDPARRRTEVEVGGKSAVRRPVIRPRGKVGGLAASSSSSQRPTPGGSAPRGGSVVKRPSVKRRPGAL